ncbi:type-1 angiotensin II receptor-associated protein-like [Amphiura filiformis]|uniref:type-1 angiotensin II receptor-associated protein-like n=1 Tax=Amphiura filiformis TaxID=82378 RepID=UPI003B219B97
MQQAFPSHMENTNYTVTVNVNMLDKISLKIVVSVHFVLTVFAYMHPFLQPVYCYMNTIILLTGLWAIATPDSKDSVLMFVVFHAVSILMDIILLGVYYDDGKKGVGCPDSDYCGRFRFSAAMAIINLLLKPVTLVVLGLEFRKRGGEYSMPGFPGMPPATQGYENIDHSIPTNQQVESAQSPSSLDRPYIPQ